MAFVTQKDYELEVLKGNVSGHSLISISGHNETATTTKITVFPTGTTTDIDQSTIHATPATVKVASTSANDTGGGTGLLTASLVGLDASGAAQSETITLTGQTAVTSANTYSSITGIVGLTAGSGNKNAGTIWVGTGVFTAGVPAVLMCSMDAESNNALTGYYTVPASKTLYLKTFTMTIASTGKDAEIWIETSSDGSFWVIQASFGIEAGVAFQTRPLTIPGLAASTHVRLTALAGSATTDLSTVLTGILVDD